MIQIRRYAPLYALNSLLVNKQRQGKRQTVISKSPSFGCFSLSLKHVATVIWKTTAVKYLKSFGCLEIREIPSKGEVEEYQGAQGSEITCKDC